MDTVVFLLFFFSTVARLAFLSSTVLGAQGKCGSAEEVNHREGIVHGSPGSSYPKKGVVTVWKELQR
jgi:hypothetical protein